MAIPQRSPYNSSSKKKPLEVKKKLLKKKPPVLVCNKAKKEDIDNLKIPTIRESDKNNASVGFGKAKTSGSALGRAYEVKTKLPSDFPICVKLMLRSHVTAGFWLSLPKQFCDLHLPKHDATVVLVDENNEEYYTKYLIVKNGLSAGWKGFSIAHNLLEGDVVLFQVIKPCRIKVYIIRSDHLAEVDAALCLLHINVHRTEMNSGQKRDDAGVLEPAGAKLQRSLLQEVSQGSYEKCIQNSNIRLVMNQPEKICEDLQLALEGLISETYSIASAVKASKTKALPDDCAIWNKRLIGYQHLRNHLGQVHAQMDQLVCLVLEWNEAMHSQNEGGYTNNLSVKVLELKEAVGRLYAELEVLKINAEIDKLIL